jgi:ribosome-binding factor A
MANARRILRLQQLILRTVATHVQREIRDPRVGLISVTRVKLSPDLTQCQVYWSCLGEEAERRTTERGLQDALPSIQRAVAGAPRLVLRFDEGLEKTQRMEEIFLKIHQERAERGEAEEPDEAADDDPA